MRLKRPTWCILAATPLLLSGCNIPRVWVEASETMRIASGDTQWLNVKTHNGRIDVEGVNSGEEIVVQVTKKAGGRTREDAEACMDAIRIVNEFEDGRQFLGWEWDVRRSRTWAARVSFDLTAPARIAADLKTHNGAITVNDITGECRTLTHNGAVTIDVASPTVHAVTHNGGLGIKAPASQIHAESHNGRLRLDLHPEGPLSGTVETHNGGITLDVGDHTAAAFDCRTHNGSIGTRLPLKIERKSRKRLVGSYGEGGGQVNVVTHNGSISIK